MRQESSSPAKKHASGGSNAIDTRGNPSAAWIGLLAPPSSDLCCLATSHPSQGRSVAKVKGAGGGIGPDQEVRQDHRAAAAPLALCGMGAGGEKGGLPRDGPVVVEMGW